MGVAIIDRLCLCLLPTCLCLVHRNLTYAPLYLQRTTQPDFRHIAFNITDEDARIDMVPTDALTHARCRLWSELDNSDQ